MAAWRLQHCEEQNTPCRQLQTIEMKLSNYLDNITLLIDTQTYGSSYAPAVNTNYSKYEHGMALIYFWMTFSFSQQILLL